MKKNLLSVIILALLIVNLALTGIVMFSTVSANKKTVALVNDIAEVLDLELAANKSEDGEAESTAVSIADTAVYNIADSMTIALRPSAGEDGTAKDHYCMCEVSFSMNTADPDYEKMSSMVEAQEPKLRNIIISVIGEYTKEDAQANQAAITSEILRQVQDMFESKFIFEVYFRDIKFQ